MTFLLCRYLVQCNNRLENRQYMYAKHFLKVCPWFVGKFPMRGWVYLDGTNRNV